jgi:hypothetical protein
MPLPGSAPVATWREAAGSRGQVPDLSLPFEIETEQEREIVSDPELRAGAAWGDPRNRLRPPLARLLGLSFRSETAMPKTDSMATDEITSQTSLGHVDI